MKKLIIASLAMAAVATAGAQSVKQLVVEETDGTKTTVNTADIQGILFEEAPQYDKISKVSSAVYYDSEDVAKYEIQLGNGEIDTSGYPVNVGDFFLSLMLQAPASTDANNPALPLGYYRVGNTGAFTFDASKSGAWLRLAEGDDGAAFAPIIGGSVDVRNIEESGAYDIRFELYTLSGNIINARYEGPVTFAVSAGDYDPFIEDQNIAFTGGQGRFYSSWNYPFSSDMTLQFYTGEFDENGGQKNGYWLNIDLYMPRVEDPMNPVQKVADGTYKVEWREKVQNSTNLPYTFVRGNVVDLWGTNVNVGTYITYIDGNTNKVGLIKNGTLTVSGSGTVFVIDFVTEEGVAIKGTYNAAPVIVNFCDNDKKEPKRPYSTLEADHTLEFSAGTVGIYFRDYDIVEGLTNYTLWLTVPTMDKGDYMQLSILGDSEGITNGTYKVSNALDANSLLPGALAFSGENLFSWYGDLDSTDSEGYQTVYAPVNSGTLTIADEGSNKKITVDFSDDNGHKITGTLTCAFINGDELTNSPRMKIMRRR